MVSPEVSTNRGGLPCHRAGSSLEGQISVIIGALPPSRIDQAPPRQAFMSLDGHGAEMVDGASAPTYLRGSQPGIFVICSLYCEMHSR